MSLHINEDICHSRIVLLNKFKQKPKAIIQRKNKSVRFVIENLGILHICGRLQTASRQVKHIEFNTINKC